MFYLIPIPDSYRHTEDAGCCVLPVIDPVVLLAPEVPMRKALFLIPGLFLIFYIAWPAWSGYRIYNALERNDIATLERKIDFPSVRESLKPAITSDVDRRLARIPAEVVDQQRDGRLKQQIGPRLVDAALNKIVTAQSIASLYTWRGDISRVLKDVKEIREIEAPAGGGNIAGTSATSSPLRLSNIKRFAFTGPTSFEIGIAKDTSGSDPDLTAQIEFRDMDWKLTGLIPKTR